MNNNNNSKIPKQLNSTSKSHQKIYSIKTIEKYILKRFKKNIK